jgi:hypothetical protein
MGIPVNSNICGEFRLWTVRFGGNGELTMESISQSHDGGAMLAMEIKCSRW